MWLRMDFIKAEVKKRLHEGERYKVRTSMSDGEKMLQKWDKRVKILKYYDGHALCMVNGKYRQSYTYQDLFDLIRDGSIK